MFQALYYQERKRIFNVTIKDLKVLRSSTILFKSNVVILVQEKLTQIKHMRNLTKSTAKPALGVAIKEAFLPW